MRNPIELLESRICLDATLTAAAEPNGPPPKTPPAGLDTAYYEHMSYQVQVHSYPGLDHAFFSDFGYGPPGQQK